MPSSTIPISRPPTGTPVSQKGRTLTGLLRELLEQGHNNRPVVELLAQRILREALTGKFPFAKEVWDRVEGRVTERHDVTVAPMTLDEKVALLTDNDLVYLAVKHNRVEELPNALRERVRKQLAERRPGGAP